MYISVKNYGQEEGFSIAYRQWRADRKSGKADGSLYSRDEIPGCNAIHGYAIGIYFEFASETLDARNWVCDFGGLRSLKEFLKESFDHTMLVAADDPMKDEFIRLHNLGLCKLVEVEDTGCEALSKFLFDYVNEIWLPENYPTNDVHNIRCRKVMITETPTNFGWYEE